MPAAAGFCIGGGEGTSGGSNGDWGAQTDDWGGAQPPPVGE